MSKSSITVKHRSTARHRHPSGARKAARSIRRVSRRVLRHPVTTVVLDAGVGAVAVLVPGHALGVTVAGRAAIAGAHLLVDGGTRPPARRRTR